MYVHSNGNSVDLDLVKIIGIFRFCFVYRCFRHSKNVKIINGTETEQIESFQFQCYAIASVVSGGQNINIYLSYERFKMIGNVY